MKKFLSCLIAFVLITQLHAQRSNNGMVFGKKADATIRLIDRELTISKDKTNSIFKFEIVNNSSSPIYIPKPETVSGNVPQYFDLRNESAICESEFMDMKTRSSREFVLIPANGSKEFELHSTFFQNSCLRNETFDNATLEYRAYSSKFEDDYIANEMIKVNRESRDVIQYVLTSKLKSQPIKINYE